MTEDAASRQALVSVLRDLEMRWMGAVMRKDLAALERILAPEYTLTTGRAGAEVRSRQEYLAIAAERYAITSFVFDELDVQLYGRVAVVRSRYRQQGSMDGESRDLTYRMTDVWVWRDSRWQAALRHASPTA